MPIDSQVRDHEPDGQAQGVDGGVDSGGQSAARATDCVSLGNPFAPPASAWAMQIAAPTITHSRSETYDNTLKRFPQTTTSVQRRNRQCTSSSSPSPWEVATGPSRLRRPEHRIHIKPIVRTKAPPVTLLAREKGAIRTHCASLNARPLRIVSVFDHDQNSANPGFP